MHTTTLTMADSYPESASPSIAFDGSRFGVAWLMRGSNKKPSLRFTLIEAGGVTANPVGTEIGQGVPSLVFHEALSRYLVLIAGSNLRLQGLDLKGNVVAPAWEVVSHAVSEAVLAPRPDGYTILYQEKDSASPLKSISARTDYTFTSQSVDSSGSHALLWIAPHGAGSAAAWGSHLVQLSPMGALSSDFGEVVGGFSPSFVVTPQGFSVAYLSVKSGAPVQTQLLDDQGRPRGAAQTVPVQATFGAAVRRWISLAPLGDHYVLAYLSPSSSAWTAVAAQLLDADLKAVGSPVQVAGCAPGSAVASLAMAVGGSRIAMAYELWDEVPGGQRTTCVTMLRCVP